MTTLDALRQIVSTPRDHVDQGRIGSRFIVDTHGQIANRPDGREKLTHVVRVLRSVLRRVA